jgi:hypothetical protein
LVDRFSSWLLGGRSMVSERPPVVSRGPLHFYGLDVWIFSHSEHRTIDVGGSTT